MAFCGSFFLQKSPWWGGFYEKLVGITRMLLKKEVGKARLSYDELVTVICEKENSINSLPLTLSYRRELPNTIIPYRFLYGRNINDKNKPLNNIETNQTSATARVKHL